MGTPKFGLPRDPPLVEGHLEVHGFRSGQRSDSNTIVNADSSPNEQFKRIKAKIV